MVFVFCVCTIEFPILHDVSFLRHINDDNTKLRCVYPRKIKLIIIFIIIIIIIKLLLIMNVLSREHLCSCMI